MAHTFEGFTSENIEKRFYANVTTVCISVPWDPKGICVCRGCFLCALHLCGLMPIKVLSYTNESFSA